MYSFKTSTIIEFQSMECTNCLHFIYLSKKNFFIALFKFEIEWCWSRRSTFVLKKKSQFTAQGNKRKKRNKINAMND